MGGWEGWRGGVGGDIENIYTHIQNLYAAYTLIYKHMQYLHISYTYNRQNYKTNNRYKNIYTHVHNMYTIQAIYVYTTYIYMYILENT